MKSALRWIVLLLGVALFGWFIQRAGPGEIFENLTHLGWLAPLVLLPYGFVYSLDTFGWYTVFGSFPAARPSYLTLLRVRWAGESINNVIPSAYIGGEALKVYLLHKRGIPTLAAGASVVASKTCQVLAQVLFIGLGALMATMHLPEDSGARKGMLVITLGSFGVVILLFALQRHGIFNALRGILAKLSIRIRALERNRDHLRELDDQIFRFYHQDRKRFFWSTFIFLGGWLADTFEIYVVCHILGLDLAWTQAVAIESFITVAKALGIFVPAALGVQESGVMVLFEAFGLPAPIGAAYAIIRRGRDLFYVLVGGLLLYSEETTLKGLMNRVERESATE